MPAVPGLSASERAALDEFVAAARSVLGPLLEEVRLFGSRARGEGHEHSDLDVAIIVGDGGRAHRREVYDLAYEIGLAHGVEVAPLVVGRRRLEELRERERLLARDLDTEGIPL